MTSWLLRRHNELAVRQHTAAWCDTAGIGHDLLREAPQAFAQAIVDVDGS